MDFSSETCCFTGHRKIPPEHLNDIARRLEEEIIVSIKKGYKYYGAGGALGFDTLAAQKIIELRAKYPEIKLILVLPCVNQTNGWNDGDKQIYEDIKMKADKIVYTSYEYSKGCMQKRNRHLVDCSTRCICYLTRNTGGTFYTVEYARKKGIDVINIAKMEAPGNSLLVNKNEVAKKQIHFLECFTPRKKPPKT